MLIEIKTIKPEELNIMESILKNLTQDSLSKIWEIKSDEIKYQFGLHLYQYAAGKYFDYNTNLSFKNSSKQVVIESYRKTKYTSSPARQFQRLLIGYYGIRGLSPKICNLSTEDANRKPKIEATTSDHVIGVTLCARYVIEVFKLKLIEVLILNDKNNNKLLNEDPFMHLKNLGITERVIEDMCENWLSEHLWLWAQCRVTITEHRSENILRKLEKLEKLETLEEQVFHRSNFKHYPRDVKIDLYL